MLLSSNIPDIQYSDYRLNSYRQGFKQLPFKQLLWGFIVYVYVADHGIVWDKKTFQNRVGLLLTSCLFRVFIIYKEDSWLIIFKGFKWSDNLTAYLAVSFELVCQPFEWQVENMLMIILKKETLTLVLFYFPACTQRTSIFCVRSTYPRRINNCLSE